MDQNIDNTFNWYTLSKNRDAIYALSIVLVMIFHSSKIDNDYLFIYNYLKRIGNIGVDIFLFMSGISLYFSMKKDENLWNFYKKRLQRIILPVLIIGIPYYFMRDVIYYKQNLWIFLKNLSGVSLFTDKIKTSWFVTAIIILYLLYPILYRFYLKMHWSLQSLLICILLVLLFNFILKYLFPVFWRNSEIIFRRFPIFIIGSYCGKLVFDKTKISITNNIMLLNGMIMLILLCLLYSYYPNPFVSYRYVFCVFSIPIAIMFSLIGKLQQIKNISVYIAPYTFECYLLNEKVANIVSRLRDVLKINKSLIINLIIIILTIVFAIILRKIEIVIINIYNKN